jgi:hypothetical protein
LRRDVFGPRFRIFLGRRSGQPEVIVGSHLSESTITEVTIPTDFPSFSNPRICRQFLSHPMSRIWW